MTNPPTDNPNWFWHRGKWWLLDVNGRLVDPAEKSTHNPFGADERF